MSRIPKKRSRPIVVDGIKYRWMIKGSNKYIGRAPASVSISIQEEMDKPGQTLSCHAISHEADEAEEECGYCSTSILPSDISLIIKAGLKRGWTPGEGSGSFDPGRIRLTGYTVK